MKSHLISSELPLAEGCTYTALCGKVVPRACWTYWFNSSKNKEFLSALSAINTCSKCFHAELPDGYLYGMISAEKVKQEEMEVA